MRDALRELGYVEGKNIFIELRRSAGSETEMRSLALDLARSKVDLIVTRGSPATRAALEATVLPIIFEAGDPVASGFAASLARPAGHGTGVSLVSSETEHQAPRIAPPARAAGATHRLPLEPL